MSLINGIVKNYGLTLEQIDEIKGLTKECEEHDKFELEVSLGFPMLVKRPSNEINDILYYDNGILVGYVGMFSIIKKDEVEISGMVHPQFRKQGIFASMLKAMDEECIVRGIQRRLLVINQASSAGKAAVEKAGAVHQFSEYTLFYKSNNEILIKTGDPRLAIKPASIDQIPILVQIGVRGFGDDESFAEAVINRNFSSPRHQIFIASYDTEDIGMITVSEEDGTNHITGFCVIPEYQGKGLGRQILSYTVNRLINLGKTSIQLDVETENLNALGLYQRCGFQIRSGFDYYQWK